MKVILSRKGFDSAAGGAPSPIVDGVPVSLPIPAADRSVTTYGDLGLGHLVGAATGGRLGAGDLCHHDPFFREGRCAFGQAGAAQGHLRNQGVGPGDLFLFFGLFAGPDGVRHHRIFGYLRVESVRPLGPAPRPFCPLGGPRPHPHTLGRWDTGNTLYLGAGRQAQAAHPGLRLTAPGGPLSLWTVPPGLAESGLTYHRRADRWARPGFLRVAGRWQEAVFDPSGAPGLEEWVNRLLSLLESPAAS